MCNNPKWIYKTGKRKETNFRGKAGEPYEIGMFAKCGDCEECISEKANNWVVRNAYEEIQHEKKCFITLTYDNEHNPKILYRPDLTNFIKRFRERIKPCKIRYFACGEYGTQKARPHYHIIIYGWQDDKARYLDISSRGNICLQSEIIQKCWKMGRTTYQEFNQNEIAYISLYTTSKANIKRELVYNRSQLKNLLKNRKFGTKWDLNRHTALLKAIEKSKKEYLRVKEFNAWSLSLGWNTFKEEYDKEQVHTYTKPIGQSTLNIPTPWLRKLANEEEDGNAIEEIYRRQSLMTNTTNEAEYKLLNSRQDDSKKEILEQARKRNDQTDKKKNGLDPL